MCAAGLLQRSTRTNIASSQTGAVRFTRNDLNGDRVSLRRYRGKVILLNFWATWCVPCRLELPRFADWQKQYGPEGLQVIAVSMDDSPRPVRAFVRKLKPNFPIIHGRRKLGTRYGGILGLPVTFLIARDGRVTARIDGECQSRCDGKPGQRASRNLKAFTDVAAFDSLMNVVPWSWRRGGAPTAHADNQWCGCPRKSVASERLPGLLAGGERAAPAYLSGVSWATFGPSRSLSRRGMASC